MGLTEAQARNPDLILLDLGLPDLEGSEVIRQVREWTTMPIIVLSARDQEQVKVAALDLGADDYVTKPFGVNELLARMRAALRHASPICRRPAEPVFTLGDLKVDLGRRQVFVSGKEIHLTPIEYKLLTTLIRYAGKVMTHRQLLKEVWGPLHVEEGHYLRVYMRQLRNKLEKEPGPSALSGDRVGSWLSAPDGMTHREFWNRHRATALVGLREAVVHRRGEESPECLPIRDRRRSTSIPPKASIARPFASFSTPASSTRTTAPMRCA